MNTHPDSNAMASELLQGLHENMWQSLRHIFNTDRILLGVTYLVNFGAFGLLLALLPERLNAAVISVICLAALNGLIFASLRNSRKEVLATILVLYKMYGDAGLREYFGNEKMEYYEKRYGLWLLLVPALMAVALILAVAISA